MSAISSPLQPTSIPYALRSQSPDAMKTIFFSVRGQADEVQAWPTPGEVGHELGLMLVASLAIALAVVASLEALGIAEADALDACQSQVRLLAQTYNRYLRFDENLYGIPMSIGLPTSRFTTATAPDIRRLSDHECTHA